MPAIKAVNSRGLKIVNCKFSGFDTDIELDNVEDFVSEHNQFSGQNDPRLLLGEFEKIIKQSSASQEEKERIFREAIGVLSKESSAGGSEGAEMGRKIRRYIGDKAVDCFVELAAAVASGLILRG